MVPVLPVLPVAKMEFTAVSRVMSRPFSGSIPYGPNVEFTVLSAYALLAIEFFVVGDWMGEIAPDFAASIGVLMGIVFAAMMCSVLRAQDKEHEARLAAWELGLPKPAKKVAATTKALARILLAISATLLPVALLDLSKVVDLGGIDVVHPLLVAGLVSVWLFAVAKFSR